MKNAFHSRISGFGDQSARIVLGVASVNHNGVFELSGKCKLFRECAPLLEPRRVVIVVIEAALTNRYGACADMLAQLVDVPRRIETRRIVRMYSGGIENVSGIPGRERCRITRSADDIAGAAARSNTDYRAGPSVAGPLDYLVAVAVERRVGEVRVAVDEGWNADVLRGHLRSIQRSTGLAT